MNYTSLVKIYAWFSMMTFLAFVQLRAIEEFDMLEATKLEDNVADQMAGLA